MKIRDAIEKLCEIEMGIEFDLDGFGQFKTVAAHPFPTTGGANVALETPCFFHTYRLASTTLQFGWRKRVYEVRIQALIDPTIVDPAHRAEIANELDEQMQDYLAANVMLEAANANWLNLRTDEGPTVSSVQWPPDSANSYIGLDYVLDVHLHDELVIGA